MTTEDSFTPAPFRLPSIDKSAAAAAALVGSVAFSIGGLSLLSSSTQRSLDDIRTQIEVLEAEIAALNARVDDVRAEFLQYFNELILISLGNRTLEVQDSVREWAQTGDDFRIRSSYSLARSTYAELVTYLLEPPGFVSGEAYLVLEELNMNLITQISAMDVVLGRRTRFERSFAKTIREVQTEASNRQRSLIEAAIRPVPGVLDVQQDQNQVFYSQKFGYSELDGSYVRVASAGAEVTGGSPARWAEWKASLDKATAKMNGIVAQRRAEVQSDTRVPVDKVAAAVTEMLATLGEEPNPPLREILAG